MPVCLTCGFHGAALIVDPSAAEEPLLGSTVAVILDEAGDLLGALAPGVQVPRVLGAGGRICGRPVAGLARLDVRQQACDRVAIWQWQVTHVVINLTMCAWTRLQGCRSSGASR